jgi:hypothetical protein
VKTLLVVTALGVFLALPATADVVNVFQIGSTSSPGNCRANTAFDPAGNCIHGSATPTWTNNFTGSPGSTAILTILAEGIDNGSVIPGGEQDRVLVNGTFVGDLTQQSFYSPLFNLSNSNTGTGPLDLDGDNGDPTVTGQPPNAQITDLSLSTFNVTALVHVGANTIQIQVDPTNWVDEIDVSNLAAVPEPSSLLLVTAGLLGAIGFIRKRLS